MTQLEGSIYRIPQQFQDRLDEEFKGKIRVRWSNKLNEWHIEQKVSRALTGVPIKDDRYADDTIRYRDGYHWIMSIKQGTRFDCPTCGLTLKAPTRETEYVSCQHCKAKGYNHYWIASHWPLDETLIQHLKKLEHEIDDTKAKLRKSDAAIHRMQQRMVVDRTADAFGEAHAKLAGILQSGYTGKEKMWIRGHE